MSQFDPLARLEQAGLGSGITDEQRNVLATLSPDEVDVLTSVKQRLDAAGPEVAAHATEYGNIWY